jgi:hypothetical protein
MAEMMDCKIYHLILGYRPKTNLSEFIKIFNNEFDIDEVKYTSTEDLLMVRKSIYLYLKTTRQKNGNAKYKNIFLRVNQELKERKYLPKKKEINTTKQRKSSFDIDIIIPNFLQDLKMEKARKDINYDKIIFQKQSTCFEYDKELIKELDFGIELFNQKYNFEFSEDDYDIYKAPMKEYEIKSKFSCLIKESFSFTLLH